jgi:hypothetical protein
MATDQDVHDLNLLAAHLDGRLTERETASVVEHLAGCEPCRGALAAFSRAAVAGAVRPSRSLSAAWLPIAATLALATTAAVVSLRVGTPTPTPPAAAPVVPRSAPSATPAPASGSRPEQPPPPAASTAPSERPSPTRAGTRRIGGKTFSLEAGVWIDSAYDPLALLPADDAATPPARAALLARVPALARFAALGENVIVVHGGAVYRLGPLSAARR